MKMLDLNKIQKGDIILTTSTAKVSKAIRTAISSDISHALICVQQGSLIDSTDDGVTSRNIQRLFYEDNSAIYVLRPKIKLSEEQISHIANYARAQVGTRYSKVEAIKSGLKKVVGGPSKKQFCSRLVGQAYASVGIKLVDYPDFCTPEDLKASELLEEVPDCVRIATDQDLSIENIPDTTNAMTKVTNSFLDEVRTRYPQIEALHDIDALLMAEPDADPFIARSLMDSGYLSLWRFEYQKNKERYDIEQFDNAPGSLESKLEYCNFTVNNFETSIYRFEVNFVAYSAYLEEHPLETFGLLQDLYKNLILIETRRKDVAEEWLFLQKEK